MSSRNLRYLALATMAGTLADSNEAAWHDYDASVDRKRYSKTEPTKKQRKARAKSKRARKARRKNRK